MNKMIGLIMGLILITTIFIVWPKSEKVHLSADVEDAINSMKPIPAALPVDVNDNYHKITLGDWSHLGVQCFHQEWNDGHVSWKNLKRKEIVIKKADDRAGD